MKKYFLLLLIFFGLLVFAPKTYAAETLAAINSASALTLPAMNASSGDLLVVFIKNEGANATAVHDSAGNTYTNIGCTDVTTVLFTCMYYAKNITGSASLVVSSSLTGSQFPNMLLWEFKGLDTIAPFDASTTQTGTTALTLTTPTFTTHSTDVIVTALGSEGGTVSTVTAGKTFGLTPTVEWPGGQGADTSGEDIENVSAGNGTSSMSWSPGGTAEEILYAVAFEQPSTNALTQSGYRFRNDDGSQTSATWQASQNVTTTEPVNQNVRLRVQLNASGTIATGTYQLEYAKNGGSWNVASATIPIASLPTIVASGTVASGTTALSVNVPTVRANDIVFLAVSTNNQTSSTAPTGGWALVGSFGAGTGTATSTGLDLFWIRATSTSIASPTVSARSAGAFAQTIVVRGAVTSGNPWDSFAETTSTVNNTTDTFNGATTTNANELAMVFLADTWSATTSVRYSAWANPRLSSLTTIGSAGTIGGSGEGLEIEVGSKATAGAVGTTTATSAATTSQRSFSALVLGVVPAPAVAPDIILSNSANIGAGGTATTTPQLTPPAGDTTSTNFHAGFISDDTNPLGALSFPANDYSELEWSIMATGTATNGNTYTFRVTNAGTVINTYSVTPAWVIGSPTTTYTQSTYRFFNNIASTTPGSPLASQNTSATLSTVGAAFRLRMLISADSATSTIGNGFNLQFAPQGTSTCSAASYTNVGTSTAIAFNTSNSPATNGLLMQATSTDPNEGRTVVNQTYVSANTFVVTSTIPAGEDGNWDFALTSSNASSNTEYCLRAAKASGAVLDSYGVYPAIMTAGLPFFSGMTVNGGNSTIILTPATTTPVTVSFQVTDSNGCSAVFSGGNVTTTLYSAAAATTTACTPNNLSCYVVSTTSNNCSSGSTANATATLNVYYLANSTGNPSSTLPSSHWYATVQMKDSANATATATSSSPTDVGVMTAISLVGASSTVINYGTLTPGGNSGSTNQITTVANVGNSSTTLEVYAVSTLTASTSSLPTSSQVYSTTSFSYPGSSIPLSSSPFTVTGFSLPAPTSTTAVQGSLYWGVNVSSTQATGSYAGVNGFSAVFSQ